MCVQQAEEPRRNADGFILFSFCFFWGYFRLLLLGLKCLVAQSTQSTAHTRTSSKPVGVPVTPVDGTHTRARMRARRGDTGRAGTPAKERKSRKVRRLPQQSPHHAKRVEKPGNKQALACDVRLAIHAFLSHACCPFGLLYPALPCVLCCVPALPWPALACCLVFVVV